MRRSSWAQAHFEQVVNDKEYVAASVMLDVNEQIVQRMEELGISQYELARRIGKSQPFISRLLNHGTNVTMLTLTTLAIALDAELVPPQIVGKEMMESSYHQVTESPSVTRMVSTCSAQAESNQFTEWTIRVGEVEQNAKQQIAA